MTDVVPESGSVKGNVFNDSYKLEFNKDFPDILSLIQDLQKINNNAVNNQLTSLNNVLDLLIPINEQSIKEDEKQDNSIDNSIEEKNILSLIQDLQKINNNAVKKQLEDLNKILNLFIESTGSPFSNSKPSTVNTEQDNKNGVIDTQPPIVYKESTDNEDIIAEEDENGQPITCEKPFIIINGRPYCYKEREGII